MNYFEKLLLLLVTISGMTYATEDSSEKSDEKSSKIQDTEAAREYFENELDFTASLGTVKKVVQKKLDGIIVDVRAEKDFKEGHVPGAINLPYDKYAGFEGKEKEFSSLSKTQFNYIYCYEVFCNLAQKAAKKFASLGYPVKEIKGGFKAWKDRGKKHGCEIEK